VTDDADPTPAGVLSYRDPLTEAWAWNRSGDPARYSRAERRLADLRRRFPHALQVRFELAFSLVKQGRRDEALAVVGEADRDFEGQLDEDTFGLWGRCSKVLGDTALARAEGLPAGGGRLAAYAEADQRYAEAAARYEKGYNLAFDRFPGINLATLRLVRAGLARALGQRAASDELLRSARDLAARLLDTSAGWQRRLPDDEVWIPATRAEAELILGHWEASAGWYRVALDHPNRQPDHAGAMRDQVGRILSAYRRLDVAPLGPLAAPEEVFR
jgi:tetratricopeptide (TPR) repeat protein